MRSVQVPSNVQVPVQGPGGAYRPLPSPPTRADDETGPEYAAALLRFLLADRCAVVLDDQQLDAAWMASQRAVTAAFDHRSEADQRVIAQLHSVRELITTTQRHRRMLPEAAGGCPADALGEARNDDHPQGGGQGGRPAVLLPQPPPALPPAMAAPTVDRRQLQEVW